MKKPIKKAYDAWHFLNEHPAFLKQVSATYHDNHFQEALDIHFALVNPKTKGIDDDNRKNTETNVWLECGKWLTAKECVPKGHGIPRDYYGAFCHDVELDCGAETFEKAIIKLANLVLKKYGDYNHG